MLPRLATIQNQSLAANPVENLREVSNPLAGYRFGVMIINSSDRLPILVLNSPRQMRTTRERERERLAGEKGEKSTVLVDNSTAQSATWPAHSTDAISAITDCCQVESFLILSLREKERWMGEREREREKEREREEKDRGRGRKRGEGESEIEREREGGEREDREGERKREGEGKTREGLREG